MAHREFPIPLHFDPARVGEVWRVPYEQRAREAEEWARQHDIRPAAGDTFRICLIAVDVQNTFCIPEFELYVGGRSGTGAIDDNRRLCEFIYRNLGSITQIFPTMDTHQATQIFHSIFLVNDEGEHPAPLTLISVEDVEQGRWKFNPAVADSLQIDAEYGQRHLLHYTKELKARGKYDLTVWPYHAMLGGIGHALVSAVEEAIFFHSMARLSQPAFEVKGSHPLTEHYSVLGPEVLTDPDGRQIAQKNAPFIEKLMTFDAVVIAGQAKSHCVAWTIDDLLEDIRRQDARLAQKVYLLEDCTSPVVAPGIVDYTEEADAAFQRFAEAGMRVVRSTDPIESWAGVNLR
ncbi:MAG: isochorismatase [Anaerolineae bacterium]